MTPDSQGFFPTEPAERGKASTMERRMSAMANGPRTESAAAWANQDDDTGEVRLIERNKPLMGAREMSQGNCRPAHTLSAAEGNEKKGSACGGLATRGILTRRRQAHFPGENVLARNEIAVNAGEIRCLLGKGVRHQQIRGGARDRRWLLAPPKDMAGQGKKASSYLPSIATLPHRRKLASTGKDKKHATLLGRLPRSGCIV